MRIKFMQNLIDKIRKKEKIKDGLALYKKYNKVYFENDIIPIDLNIEGQKNIIKIGKNSKIKYLKINGYCDNCKITIGDNFNCGSLTIILGQNHENFGKINNTNIYIGDNVSFGYENKIVTFNSNNNIKIDNDSMIASEVTLYNTDAHPIYDINKTKIINKVSDMQIGKHVWIGCKVTILKNVKIEDNCIVGYGSVVSKSINKKNAIIAGVPAKLVKQEIVWDKNGSNGYIQNPVTECISWGG